MEEGKHNHNQELDNMSQHKDHQHDDGQDGKPLSHSLVKNKFSEEEIQNLKDIFDLFDKDKAGSIELSDLEAIMMSLKRDPKEAKEMLNDIDPNNDGTLTFDEFLHLMTSLEKQLVGGMDANGRLPQLPNEMQIPLQRTEKGVINISADSKVIDFLK